MNRIERIDVVWNGYDAEGIKRTELDPRLLGDFVKTREELLEERKERWATR